MKKILLPVPGKVIIALLFFTLFVRGFGQPGKEDKIPLAPPQNRRPADFKAQILPEALNPERVALSEEMMQRAAGVYEKVSRVNNSGRWKPAPGSIDSHKAPEWFKDAKFGMFIDWGLWSVAGWAPKREKGAMYPDWYEFRMDEDSAFRKYHEKNWGKDFKRDDLIPLFTASEYQPERLAEIAKEAGMKYIVPFCKHHSGFCLWPSSFTGRDAGDMGPHRDLVKPMVEECRKNGLKFGFYFSLEEWEYPVIGEDGNIQNRVWGGKIKNLTPDLEKKTSGKIPVKDFAKDYLVPQAAEFIDKYDPDILWYDGDWSTSAEDLHSYDITSYFYNRAEGRKEVAVNDRYGTENGKWLRSRRGDIFTNEYGDMEKEARQTHHAWEENRGISQSFGYNWQDTEENVISSKNFIDMFIDVVANGGNLLLIVNLDGKGALPKVQENRLRDIGKWLKINGEGIYSTRPCSVQFDGSVAYTASKDNGCVYAIMKEWPGNEITLHGISAGKESKIELLGDGKSLAWDKTKGGIKVKFPAQLQDSKNRPCEHAWILKISSEGSKQ
jgi:alpha-L-fucosidase